MSCSIDLSRAVRNPPGEPARVDLARAPMTPLPSVRPNASPVLLALIADGDVERALTVLPDSGHDSLHAFLDPACVGTRVLVPRGRASTGEGEVVVADYVEGVTLGELMTLGELSARPVPIAVALAVALDVAAALCAYHAAAHVAARDGGHGVLTPRAVLVASDGRARLLEPSLVGGVDGSRRRLAELSYHAPERLEGGAATPSSDLFALGVLTWELLARRRLFRGSSIADTTRKIMVEPVPRLSEENHALGPFDDVLRNVLGRRPGLRYESVESFRVALLRVATGRQPVATSADVAKYVSAVAGDVLTSRRACVSRIRERARAEARTTSWSVNAPPARPRLPAAHDLTKEALAGLAMSPAPRAALLVGAPGAAARGAGRRRRRALEPVRDALTQPGVLWAMVIGIGVGLLALAIWFDERDADGLTARARRAVSAAFAEPPPAPPRVVGRTVGAPGGDASATAVGARRGPGTQVALDALPDEPAPATRPRSPGTAAPQWAPARRSPASWRAAPAPYAPAPTPYVPATATDDDLGPRRGDLPPNPYET